MIFKKKESTQELLGIEAITDYGIPCNGRCQLIRLRVRLTKYSWVTDRERKQDLKAHVQMECRAEYDDAYSRGTLQG